MNKQGKVWGETWSILQNPLVEFHRISIKAGYRCSTHTHLHKWNGFFVESGILEIHVIRRDYNPRAHPQSNHQTLTDITSMKAGDFNAVKPGLTHWFQCVENCIAFELYWPETLSEDIVREDVGRKL